MGTNIFLTLGVSNPHLSSSEDLTYVYLHVRAVESTNSISPTSALPINLHLSSVHPSQISPLIEPTAYADVKVTLLDLISACIAGQSLQHLLRKEPSRPNRITSSLHARHEHLFCISIIPRRICVMQCRGDRSAGRNKWKSSCPQFLPSTVVPDTGLPCPPYPNPAARSLSSPIKVNKRAERELQMERRNRKALQAPAQRFGTGTVYRK